jgi:hypothetical protein
MPPFPLWLQQWVNVLLEALVCAGLPWQAAAVVAVAFAGMILAAISSVK